LSGETPLEPAPRVRLCGLSKRFGAVQAVDRVDLELHAGEIHGLLGENGAGKSTLMCLLAGLYRPDAGHIELDRTVVSFRSPRDAMAASVGMVHQHFMLVPTLTVWENVLLGTRDRWLLRPARAIARVEQAAERLSLRVDARALVGDLGVGQQQRVEILRVLMQASPHDETQPIRVMILDEPTAVLSPDESVALFATLRALCQRGCAIVIISHKLDEVRQAARRISVMRRGRLVERFPRPAEVTTHQLAAAMVGEEISLELDRPASAPGEVLLRIRGLTVASSHTGRPAVRDLDLELRSGEILGLAGVAGNGQVELMEAIAGLRPMDGGTVELCGQDAATLSIRQRIALGLRYIPEDRMYTGTAPSLSVLENLVFRRYPDHGPWLRLQRYAPWCQQQIERLQIATSGPAQAARLLSGGNLQKVVLARELDRARVILALHPTRGLDVRATTQVRQLLLRARSEGATLESGVEHARGRARNRGATLERGVEHARGRARSGGAILLWSEDLEEVLALSDRVAVIKGGRIVYTAAHDEVELPTVGRWMTGGGAANAT